MKMDDRYRQFIKNQYPDQYRQLLKIERDNEEAIKMPKDEITLRLEALGFRRGAVSALSDTHYFSTPCNKKGEYSLSLQKGNDIDSSSDDWSFRYEPGVDIWKPCGRILKEGSYSLEEFESILVKMEGSPWYREKKDNKKRLPVLSILQRKVYDALPPIFRWGEGKAIAAQSGMPLRTAQRFYGNQALFHKVRNGTYMKIVIYDDTQ